MCLLGKSEQTVLKNEHDYQSSTSRNNYTLTATSQSKRTNRKETGLQALEWPDLNAS